MGRGGFMRAFRKGVKAGAAAGGQAEGEFESWDHDYGAGYEEEDQGFGAEADEGDDSDVDAEVSEMYNRRPKPADGPIESTKNGGFIARQPCAESLVAPTGHSTAHNAHEKPDNRLELDFVHGYRAHDTRHNILYNAQGMIVYFAASLGIVYDFDEHSQVYFTGHSDAIVSIAMHPEGDIVATGQVGKTPLICVWSTSTCMLLAELKGFHQKAVVSLSFDATGKFLASVGMDDEHSVAVYNWEQRKCVVNSKGDLNRILLCEYNPYDGRLLTGGVKHLKFWVMEGGYLVGKDAVYGRIGAASTVLSVVFHPNGKTYTGTQSGAVYAWKEGTEECFEKYDMIHQGPVNDMMLTEDYIITGGKDGKINFFDLNFDKIFTVEMSKVAQSMNDENGRPICYYDGRSLCVRAIYMDGTNLLVGLRSSEIFELDMSSEDSWKSNQKIITQGHSYSYNVDLGLCDGELWALDTHPSQAIIMSAGDDKTVRLWDIYDRSMVSMRNLPERARSCCFNKDGTSAVVGFANGGFMVFESASGKEIASKRHRREEISQIKYSPSGRWLAAGSHDNFIDIYDATRNYKRVGTCKGHASYITHLDWSMDSVYIQSNSGDNEIMFWEIPACENVKFPAALKDVEWTSFTCTLGWPSQGIWPKYADGTDMTACDRSRDHSVIAATDDFGLVKLYRYPSDVGRADYLGYVSHAAHATNVKFVYNDEFLVTIGGGDLCVMQWRHFQADEDYEELTSDVEQEVVDSMEDYKIYNKGNQIVSMTITGYNNGLPIFTPIEAARAQPVRGIPKDTGLDAGSRLLYMECATSIFGPENYIREPDALSACMEAIELDFVYGYRTHDARDNLFFSNVGEIVLHSGCVAIAYNKESNTQRHLVDDPTTDELDGHTEDILCLARHPTGSIFATGEVGMSPKLLVWSTLNMSKPRTEIQGFFKTAIVACTFSRDGSMIAAVGADPDHSIALYKWQTGTLVASSRGSQEKIVCIKWSPFQDYIVTLGVKHCKFWSLEPFRSKRAEFTKGGRLQTMLCCCFPGPDNTVVGTQDGSLYLFKGFQLSLVIPEAHEVTQALSATRDVVVSAGKEGMIKFWAIDLSQCLKEVAVSHPQISGCCIKALHLLGTKLLFGTRTGDIFEMDATSYSYNLLLQGHSYGAIHGLATHPMEHQFVTTGDDMTIRVWDIPSRRMIMYRALGAKGRSVAYHPDGSQVSVGLAGGGFVVLSADSLDTVYTKKERDEAIHDLKYSPNGLYLAVGSYDNFIDIYDVSKDYGRVGVAKGHSSYVRHLDWSADSTILQSNSGNMEILFWDMPSGKQIMEPADTRNTEWYTWTSVAGWPVQGIWPKFSNGRDIICLDRSHTQTCICTGDNYGMINMFMYPCHKGCARRVFTGHSSRVLNLRFAFDDTYLISVGGDMSILQWRIVL